jgi:protein transport protein YIF1
MRRSETGVSEFQPPRDDLNAPDLYIPGMLLPYALSLSVLTYFSQLWRS